MGQGIVVESAAPRWQLGEAGLGPQSEVQSRLFIDVQGQKFSMNEHIPCRIHVEDSADGQGIELVFRSITPEDSGNYACEATLEGVVERAEFELKVIGESSGNKSKQFNSSSHSHF